jgi:hypothetical protein
MQRLALVELVDSEDLSHKVMSLAAPPECAWEPIGPLPGVMIPCDRVGAVATIVGVAPSPACGCRSRGYP